jgi:hypothetical protein
MSKPRESVNADIMGRVMSLEQRTQGLQGRLAALEARLSDTAGNAGNYNDDIREDVEFVAAIRLTPLCPGPSPLEIPAEHGLPIKSDCNSAIPGQRVLHSIDATGVVAGTILLGAGLLLSTGNVDLIKNPLLSLGCGIFLILLSLMRPILVKTISGKNIE